MGPFSVVPYDDLKAVFKKPMLCGCKVSAEVVVTSCHIVRSDFMKADFLERLPEISDDWTKREEEALNLSVCFFLACNASALF